MSIAPDLQRGITYGEPDGPDQFVEELGLHVPTYVNPRTDLLPHMGAKFQRLSHHVPFEMRGIYKREWLPVEYLRTAHLHTDLAGYVLCNGTKQNGEQCPNRAVNRAPFCKNHGGALHPADKKMSAESNAPKDAKRVAKMDRPQKFMQGLLTVEELDDEEIQKLFIRNNDGVPVPVLKLGPRFVAQVTRELHARLNRYLQSKTPAMLHVMVDIAESDLVEPADRIRAAIWVAERTMGKTPDVLIHGTTDKPFQSIFEQIETTSREDYRAIESSRPEVVDAEVVEYSENDDYSDPLLDDEQGDSGPNRDCDASIHDDNDERDRGEDGSISGLRNTSHDINPRIPVDDPHGYANEVIRKKAEAKELRERIARNKRRRIVARIQGVGLHGDVSWVIQFKKKGSEVIGVLVPPHKQTEKLLAKIEASASA